MQTDTSVIKLDINLLIPNKYQPRKVFDEQSLNTLAESIKSYGIINPILVRQKDDKYEIIAGERRFRAAKKAGLTEVPVIVKSADEQQMAELALIENIQRKELSPIEEAKSYEEIMKIGNQTQSSLAEKLGKSQSSIANKIRLLTLPVEIQEALAHKKISERHARSLISVEDKERQLELLEQIINEKLTVKETEQIINSKEITEKEIKQAINDIMKTLNISEEEEKDEKEDDNMNNGNFFPSFDNNNVANNNASLNMMNMQSMNQTPIAPEPEVVMPTMAPPVSEPQMVIPQAPVEPQVIQPVAEQPMNSFEPFSPVQTAAPDLNMNNNPNSMDSLAVPQNNMAPQIPSVAPTLESPVENSAPIAPEPVSPAQPQVLVPETPVLVTPLVDTPLFNPEVTMPSLEPTITTPTEPVSVTTGFEVPVTNVEPMVVPTTDKLADLQNYLTTNGYNYKVYNNETDNCVIIEIPKN